MREIVAGVPFTVLASLVLIGVGAALASNGPWIGKGALSAAVFIGIVATGAAIRRRQQHR